MIAHVVLFEPRAGLSSEERGEFVTVLERACREIPNVQRARVGRRVTIGAGYESLARETYSFIAILEFDDADALRAYLAHAFHAPLGRLFWQNCERTLIVDSEVVDPNDGAFAAFLAIGK